MGRFSDRVREIIKMNKNERVEFNRSVGLNDDAKIIPVEQMQDPLDAYFLKVKGLPNSFVKYRDGDYHFEPNPEMACLFTRENGQKFIDNTLHPALELVPMDHIVKK